METRITGLKITKAQWDSLKKGGLLIDENTTLKDGFVELGKSNNRFVINVELDS